MNTPSNDGELGRLRPMAGVPYDAPDWDFSSDGSLAEGLFDSAIGAWISFGSLMAIVAMKLLGWIGLWPADSADIFDGDE